MTEVNTSSASHYVDPHLLIERADTVTDLLEQAVAAEPDRVYAADWTGSTITRLELLEFVQALTTELEDAGVSGGSRVATALPTSLLHIALVFATLRAGAVWVPLNTKLRGESLHHQLRDSGTTHVITDPDGVLYREMARTGVLEGPALAPLAPYGTGAQAAALWATGPEMEAEGAGPGLPDSVVSIMYTSGTTGPAKGVQITASMLIASAAGVMAAADPREGDVFYVWEPLFHIGGAQLMVLPLVSPMSLALSQGLSISRFWDEVTKLGATHIHHLGGILQMLLNRPPSPADRAHRVRISWGAGATPRVWEEARDRFGIAIHECYGLTEVSSILTVNKSGPAEGIGQPLPWFETALAPRGHGGAGELLVRGKTAGLITPGYLNRPEATKAARSGDWWRTGDLVRLDDAGNFHFAGRVKESFRVRGENVSAWQVESVLNSHPLVAQCAAVGVEAEVGEQEILLFVVPVDQTEIDPVEFYNWASERMPDFQVPRYLRIMSELPMTPSHRVAKKKLSADLDGVVDLRNIAGK